MNAFLVIVILTYMFILGYICAKIREFGSDVEKTHTPADLKELIISTHGV